MDRKVNRRESLLHIHHLVLESSVSNTDDLFSTLRQELAAFLLFNSCHKLRLGHISPAKLKPALQRVVEDLTGWGW